jgi:hypothetical protein
MATSQNISSLVAKSARDAASVNLNKIVFAIDELGETKLGKFDPAKPSMWESIGPLKSSYGAVVALVRVIEANKGYVPQSPELTYDTKGAILDSSIVYSDNMYNLKENIIEDLKKLSAVKAAKEQAAKFIASLKDKSWEDAVKDFNKGLDKDDSLAELSLGKQEDKTRFSLLKKKINEIRKPGMNPILVTYMNRITAVDEHLQEELYALVGENESEAKDVQVIIDSPAEGACYVVKDVSIQKVNTKQYEDYKLTGAFQMDLARSNNLALIHFSPQNIKTRMGFERVIKEEEDDDDNNSDENGDS